MKEKLSEIKGALLTGVSYMLPFVIAGGILIALGFAIGGYDIPNSVEEYGNFASTIFWLGKKAFALMVPVLGAYVAYSIADKPGIAVGMVGGALADMQGSGFLGALIAGIIAGYLVNLLKKINLPMALKSLLPTLIIPIIGVGAIGLIMVYVIGTPLSALTTALTDMLNSLGTGNLVVPAIRLPMPSRLLLWMPETTCRWQRTLSAVWHLRWQSRLRHWSQKTNLQRRNVQRYPVCLPEHSV